LIITIWAGSFPDMTRVKLLSRPQHKHARMIRIEPGERPKVPEESYDNKSPPDTTAIIAQIPLFPRGSRNPITAIRVVNASSALRSSEAVDAGVVVRPTIQRIGPITLPKTITPISQGRSVLRIGDSFFPSGFVSLRMMSPPIPAPTYSNPARVTGPILKRRILEAGTTAPNKAAARSAISIASRSERFMIDICFSERKDIWQGINKILKKWKRNENYLDPCVQIMLRILKCYHPDGMNG